MALRSIVADDARSRARRYVGLRRGAALLGLATLFAAGLAVFVHPGFGANSSPSDSSPCGPGASSLTGAHLSEGSGTVTATFTVAAGCDGTTVSLASYSMLAWPASEFPQTLYDSVTRTLDAGSYTLTVRLPSCYWQADLVTGLLLPYIDANHLYGGRKAVPRESGGPHQPCSAATTTGTTQTGTTQTGTTQTGTTQTTTTGTTQTGTTQTGTTQTTTTGTTQTGTTQTGTTQTTTTGTTQTGTTQTGTQTGTTQTTTTGTTQTTTTSTTTTVTTPTTTVVTPPVPCSKITFTLAPRTAVVGRQTQLVVHARRNGKGVGGVRVELRGPGVLVTRKTNSDGVARFTVKPHGIGILRVRLLQAASCSHQLGEIPVRGPFTPPLLTG